MLILIDNDWDYIKDEIKLKAEQVNALYNQKDKDCIYNEEKFNFFILSINYTLSIVNPIKSKKPKEVLDKLKPFAEAHINSLLDELIFILEQTPYKEKPIIEIEKILPANVTKPNHYKGKNLECVQAIDEILLVNNSQGVSAYYLSNIVKYIWRYKNKNGIQDLQKAKKCIELLIEEEQKTKQ